MQQTNLTGLYQRAGITAIIIRGVEWAKGGLGLFSTSPGTTSGTESKHSTICEWDHHPPEVLNTDTPQFPLVGASSIGNS